MATLVGEPSDQVPAILATGHSDVTTVFVSFSARHPEGRDAAYIEWHSLDHRPEQYRLPELRSSLRLVSTPACRAARAASSGRFDQVDHVMTYLFSDAGALDGFVELSDALRGAGRTPEVLPPVERGVFAPRGMQAAPRVKVGAEVLPWWPVRGVYLLVEQTAGEALSGITDVPGVGGVWWMQGIDVGPPNSAGEQTGLQVSYCYLDDDPVEVARRLRPHLERRWAAGGVEPVLAAPFHPVVAWEWDRYLP